MSEIEYFYAAHSAYAWLGSAKFMEIAKQARGQIVHKPVDLNQLLVGAGSVAFANRPLNVRNYLFNRELERWAEFRGIKTLGRRPANHHHSPDLANRMLIAAALQGHNIDELAHRLLTAHWGEEADLADPGTLKQLAREVDLDGDASLEAADTKAVHDAYAANTREAIERGVLGSPTYVVDGDLFYGQDRLDLVERALKQPFTKNWPPLTK